jgi:gamma-glutamyl hercynylcysteine S-oxide synthase
VRVLVTQSKVAHQLLERISEARRLSDALFRLVRRDALYDRPIAERHRILFYIGHLEAFDWNLLHESLLSRRSAQAGFDQLFAFGIDPVSGGLPDDQPGDWPRLPEVQEYVRRTRDALDEKLAEADLESPHPVRDSFTLSTLLNVSVEHRLMHLETLAYMLHQMPVDRKVTQISPHDALSEPVRPRMIGIPAGPATLGLSRDSESFGWDNEYVAHTSSVPSFEIDQYKVTNRQYLEFIAAGGYEARGLWNDDAWEWKSKDGISYPVFWKKNNQGWLYTTMFEVIPLPLEWPVYVSHAEATAYSRWAGKSLPTEEEWHRAAYGTPHGTQRFYPWGNEAPTAEFGNFDFSRWNPAPVNAHTRGGSAFGVQGMLGNGWEWTSTVFGPFQGFEPFPFYRGYSADFFDGKHFVIKGASARTAASMLRPTFRNWFQAHYQYMYAGFRCVSR